ncbi:MAG: response regulator [Sphingobacteriaceae bacterium]|nr:response regulator [Sphingobacteriaceae bacterium]
MKPLKIAVVDDDQIYQFIINRTLTKLQPDSKILNFSNCADFFNFLKRNRNQPQFLPDLALLDLNSPFMDGWEFLESFEVMANSLKKSIEIYIVTSSVDPNDEIQANDNPLVAGFFCKPITPAQLLRMMEEVRVKSL